MFTCAAFSTKTAAQPARRVAQLNGILRVERIERAARDGAAEESGLNIRKPDNMAAVITRATPHGPAKRRVAAAHVPRADCPEARPDVGLDDGELLDGGDVV